MNVSTAFLCFYLVFAREGNAQSKIEESNRYMDSLLAEAFSQKTGEHEARTILPTFTFGYRRFPADLFDHYDQRSLRSALHHGTSSRGFSPVHHVLRKRHDGGSYNGKPWGTPRGRAWPSSRGDPIPLPDTSPLYSRTLSHHRKGDRAARAAERRSGYRTVTLDGRETREPFAKARVARSYQNVIDALLQADVVFFRQSRRLGDCSPPTRRLGKDVTLSCYVSLDGMTVIFSGCASTFCGDLHFVDHLRLYSELVNSTAFIEVTSSSGSRPWLSVWSTLYFELLDDTTFFSSLGRLSKKDTKILVMWVANILDGELRDYVAGVIQNTTLPQP
ncbi:uncharacterized protein LOC135398183 [Ornithodoros turicata]|uniref:uncharacterized protein LOC135398183 n=1 Tax=Ornithodoros turicata TaxID=34597 RepID=UPI003139EE07